MPSLFDSSASRSRSIPEYAPNATPNGPCTRKSSAAIEALTRSLRKKSELEVVLDGKDDFVRTYSTFDQVKGHVELKFEKDTLIGDLHIHLEGHSATFVERVAAVSPTTGRTTGKHTFLRMQQPIASELLPEDNLAKANVAYTIPFTFVVPDRLLPYVCAHKVDNDEVKRSHLLLPPSIGDPMLAGEGNALMDDLTPEMAKIVYSIRAKIGKASPATGRLYDIEERVVKIRIAPAREEEPPLSVDEGNTSYVLRAEKNVRKGVLKIGKKLGRLTAEVSQPKSLRLPSPNSTSTAPVTTMTAVTVRFDPASEQEQPPQMSSLATKLKINTFFGAAAYKFIPEVSKCDGWSTLYGYYPESLSLSCRSIRNVAWTKHEPDASHLKSVSIASDHSESSRRPSNYSIDSEDSYSTSASVDVPAASSAYDPSLPFYTAKVLVPVSLPHHRANISEADTDTGPTQQCRKQSISSPTRSASNLINRSAKKTIFIPTFHTCIVSRTYTLELGLSFNPVNSQGNTNALSASSVTLRTPIQISQESSSSRPSTTEEGISQLHNLSLVEGADEYDEAMGRHLDAELNRDFSFSNPFADGRPVAHETIPEYEEVQTTLPDAAPRHSIAIPPSATQQSNEEQPPEYYSPFRISRSASAAAVGAGHGRRHTVITQHPPRCALVPIAFLSAL